MLSKHGRLGPPCRIPLAAATILDVVPLAQGRFFSGADIMLNNRGAREHEIHVHSPPIQPGLATRISAVIEGFNAHHERYQATLQGGVVVIRPTTNRLEYLERAAPAGGVHVRGLMGVMRVLFAPLDPSLNAPGGILGSLPGGPQMDQGENLQFDLETRGKSILQVLNEIASKAPGHGWLVTTRGRNPASVSEVGWLHGSKAATYIPLHAK